MPPSGRPAAPTDKHRSVLRNPYLAPLTPHPAPRARLERCVQNKSRLLKRIANARSSGEASPGADQTWAGGDGLRRHRQPGAGPRGGTRRRRLLWRGHTHYGARTARLRYFVGSLQNLVGLIFLWASEKLHKDAILRYYSQDIGTDELVFSDSSAKLSVLCLGNDSILANRLVYRCRTGWTRDNRTNSYCTIIIVAIKIIVELDWFLKTYLGESLSWQPADVHPWIMWS